MSEEEIVEQSKKDEGVGYLIAIQKQSVLSGELISISTNLPKNSTSEDLRHEIDLITQAIDWRIPKDQGMKDQAMIEKMLGAGPADADQDN
jgi:hypothetical protein